MTTSLRRLYKSNRPKLKCFPIVNYKRKVIMKKAKSKLEVVNPDAAGIDIGSAVHYVCVLETLILD